MNDIEFITTFLGWCSVINISLLVLSTISLMLMREPILRLHSKLFKLSQASLPPIYFQYLAAYKLAILIFNLVPYIALKVMSSW